MRSPGRIVLAEVCPDGKHLAAVGGDAKTYIWNLPSGEPAGTLEVDDKPATALVCSSDGRWLAIGTSKGSIAIVDIASGTVQQRLTVASSTVEELAFSPDATLLAIAPADIPAQLWNVRAAKLTAVLQTDFGGSDGLAFSPDGKLVASADADTTIRIYDAMGRLKASAPGLLLEPFTVAFTPDGKELAVAGADGIITFLDAGTGQTHRRLPRQAGLILGLQISPDGQTLTTWQADAASLRNRYSMIWNLTTGQSHVVPATNGPVVGAGRSTDRHLVLVTAGSDQILTVWAVF